MASARKPRIVTSAETTPMVPRILEVEKIVRETHDTFTIQVNGTRSKTDKHFAPGQFNMLYMFGIGEVPISISGDAADPSALLHTTRVVGKVTKAINQLRRGDPIGVRGPFGTSWPVDEAKGKDVVLVAGGIGLAPLRPVIYHLLAQRDHYGKVTILYGTRTPNDILFRGELERWRSRFDIEVCLTVDRATSGWRGNVGVVTTLISKAPFDPMNAIAMICGPEIMMRYTAMQLQERGLEQDRIYVSMERNMKCGIGLCGHCQYGPHFVCKDGPVFSYRSIRELLTKREV